MRLRYLFLVLGMILLFISLSIYFDGNEPKKDVKRQIFSTFTLWHSKYFSGAFYTV